jgi:hypothetical protein
LQAKCLTEQETAILAQAIRDLDTCKQTLVLREKFIETEMPRPIPIAVWQEPYVIVGGVVVSFGLGLVLGAALLGK